MLSPTFESPPVITGKRKRATVSYAEEIIEAIDSNDIEGQDASEISLESDDDAEYGKCGSKKNRKTRQSMLKKKAKAASSKKAQQHFRFMDLSAELRNRIYEMALMEANGISLVAKTKAYRRTVCRAPVYDEEDTGYAYWRRRSRKVLKSNEEETAPKRRDLVPNLLAVSKQIYSEGVNYLYNQDIFFADTMALHQFLANIGPDNMKRLSSIAIKNWGVGRGAHKTMNHSAFALLAGAVNLKALLIDCVVDYASHPSGSLARQIYREMHFFLEAYGRANGDKCAAIRIMEFSESNFQGGHGFRRRGCDPATATTEEIEANFRKALGDLLSSR